MGALVLIPGCKEKRVESAEATAEGPVPGILPIRDRLVQLLERTPHLASIPENKTGILDPRAKRVPACKLYQGKLYQKCEWVLQRNHVDVQVLIVSALYGLVRPGEAVKNYDLSMGNRLHDGPPVYKFWMNEELDNVLRDHVETNEISFVWSLLPDSMPMFPYHRIFDRFWSNPGTVHCYKVEVSPGGSVIGQRRGEWLDVVLRSNPRWLSTFPLQLPEKFSSIPGYSFRYESSST